MNITKNKSLAWIRKIAAAALLVIGVVAIPAIFTSCEIEDAVPGGGGGGSSVSSKSIIGSWTRQIQWAYTNGTREDTYTFYSGGTGRYKGWDWLEQKYVYQDFRWSFTGGYIEAWHQCNDCDFNLDGYLSSGGDAMKLGGYWYNKQ